MDKKELLEALKAELMKDMDRASTAGDFAAVQETTQGFTALSVLENVWRDAR